MSASECFRIAYVLKRYPRYSETFIVNEILAHEAAGISLDIFALRPPNDTHFQDAIARVRAPVTYLLGSPDGTSSESLSFDAPKASHFWSAVEKAAELMPSVWNALQAAQGEESRDVYQALLLARQVRTRGINHLHAHFATSAATVARLAARFAGIPYTFTAHAKDIFHKEVRSDDLRRKLADAAATVTVSDFNFGYLRQEFGPSATRVRRIYNGLDLERFRFQSPQNRSPRIVAVGRLIEKKGFSDLIDACSILQARGCQFSCQIVGTGPLESRLREQINQRNLQDRVELLGPRPQADVIQLLQNSAVLAVPCVISTDGDRDGLPTILLEAMALGTPCVATDVTGIPEVVRDGATGLLLPQHEPAALAAAIRQLLTDGTLATRLAKNARDLIEADYDVKCNAALLRETFMECISRARVESANGIGLAPAPALVSQDTPARLAEVT